MKPIDVVIVGAGQRGMIYGGYILRNPHQARVVAVADPDPERLTLARQQFNLTDNQVYQSWEDLLGKPQMATAAIIATQDRMHYEPTMLALRQGYHVLLEKPMSPNPQECLEMADAAEKLQRNLTVCHVLRYTPFMQTLKELLESGAIGQLMSVQWTENVGFWHQAHSFVRGNWRNSKETSPMILAKSCHDVDAIQWMVGTKPERLSSFGSLSHFRPENMPQGATDRCTDGCPVENECPYSAIRLYLGSKTSWPVSVISNDTSMAARLHALQTGPYGRCVYKCDNDVVDHQVVNIEFAGGVTVAFTMCAFSQEICRTIKMMGTHGEIRAHADKPEIVVTSFASGTTRTIVPRAIGGHGGGDEGLMRSFLEQLRTGCTKNSLTSARTSAESHLLAFAAEYARTHGVIVNLDAYSQSLRSTSQAS